MLNFLLIHCLITPEATTQSSQKPHKRRVLLLKRKAVTTGIFDSKGKDDYSNKGKQWSVGKAFEAFTELILLNFRWIGVRAAAWAVRGERQHPIKG